MATKKKMLEAAAGGAGGAGLDITDLFSTYLYAGNSGTQTVNNGIDLTEGGLVWVKNRSNAQDHILTDSSTSGAKYLNSNTTTLQQDFYTGGGSDERFFFNSTGWSTTTGDFKVNNSQYDYTSWNFRKAPKFFTCLTYSGTGDTTTQTISHDLGAVPGCIIVKRTDSSDSWRVYHRGVDVNGDGQPWTDMLTLNHAYAATDYPVWGDTAPTSTQFTVGYESSVNASGGTYVAYLFAHNDGDGEFGPNSDQDIIKCGSYTGTGSSSSPPVINLGFEPQWLMVKSATRGGQNWEMFDNMRGVPTGGITAELFPNTSSAERAAFNIINFTSTGFEASGVIDETNENGQTFIYMAIRRGPLAAPEDATKVFSTSTAVQAFSNTSLAPSTGFPVDLGLHKVRTSTGGWRIGSRLTGKYFLRTNSTNAQADSSSDVSLTWDHMDTWGPDASGDSSASMSWWNWKRAPGHFDAVAYSGTGSAGANVFHNLGVKPELLISKARNSTSDWYVSGTILGDTGFDAYNLKLNSTASLANDQAIFSSAYWDNGFVYNTGQNTSLLNASGTNYIAYLFSSLAGVSKVGSVSHTSGSATNVDCGFTAGCRFLILKRTDAISDWWVFDTARGITSGNDARLLLNSAQAETSTDQIDPYSAGFTIDGNRATGDYIFYAIA